MTQDSPTLSCNFCGKNRDQVEKLIAGPDVYICNECIELSYNITVTEKSEEFDIEELDNLLTPTEIYNKLDEYIIGHAGVKELLSVSAYNHYKRIAFNRSEDFDVDTLDKSNILLMGNTGTGKTLFAKTLAKILNVPMTIADATTLTEAGYVGEDVEGVIERLLTLTNWDKDSAEKGIIFIDEIDKKARRSESNTATRDVSGEGVQQALLRLIEGTIVKIKMGNSKRLAGDEFIEFDTSNILFIMGGAFVGLDKIIEKRLKKKSGIGFGSTVLDATESKKLTKLATHDDFVTFGLIPELVGRTPLIGILDQFETEDFKKILSSVKNNILSQVKVLFDIDNIRIEFGDDYITYVAEQAATKSLGARAIKTLVDQSLISLMFRAPDLHNKDVAMIKLNKYPLTKEDFPVLYYSNNESEIDRNYKLHGAEDL